MRRLLLAAALVAAALAGAGCDSYGLQPGAVSGRVVRVVAAEDFWGSVAAQVGGTHARVTSIVTSPDVDPHSYEPTASDARLLARAGMVVVNGLGYDAWATRLLAAQPGPGVVDVGSALGLRAGANPHRWYDPADVRRAAAAMSRELGRLDPADEGYFRARRDWFDTVALAGYDRLVAAIRASYSGTPVGASESIFSLLAPALGLDVVTPPSFLRAISEGNEVRVADKTLIDRQITSRRIRVYVYNSQNETPDVAAQVAGCRAAGIPTVAVTETLSPAGATFQAWQTRQLQAILAALARSGDR